MVERRNITVRNEVVSNALKNSHNASQLIEEAVLFYLEKDKYVKLEVALQLLQAQQSNQVQYIQPQPAPTQQIEVDVLSNLDELDDL